MRNFTIVLADGNVRTAKTRATTLRGVLAALGVTAAPSVYLRWVDKVWDEVWDEATGELIGQITEN